jgi:hypothetical protein
MFVARDMHISDKGRLITPFSVYNVADAYKKYNEGELLRWFEKVFYIQQNFTKQEVKVVSTDSKTANTYLDYNGLHYSS